ncbi:putative membrane protein C6F6.13c [Cladobotryum mycophilum]|uniref:Membrane protein C6F6.13c n=1 Tax=Cladobotryum mycophilum TaxID=491253 RepID=A0ABR0SKT6_9HYPO
MAPLCADPRQIVITLEPARRQALLKLVHEITNYMISQWQTRPEELGAVSLEDERKGDASDPEKPRRNQSEDGTSKQAENVQRAALKYALEWRDELLSKLDEIVSVQDTPKILSERKKRDEELEKKLADSDYVIDSAGMKINKKDDISALRAMYHPLPTKLSTIPQLDRKEALSCILVLLLSTGKYSAHSRILVLYLASSLELPQTFINNEEAEIAKSLMESTSEKGKEAMSAEAEAAKRRQENKVSRFWKVGLASVAGAAVIGVTGGLAAPLVAGAIGGILGGVGLGGVASFLGIFWMNGALVGALFGAYGAKMTGEMMDSYAKEVEDFRFLPLDDFKPDNPTNPRDKEKQRRLRVTIGITGWLTSEEDVTEPWRILGSDAEVFALRYEMDAMLAFGTSLHEFIQSMAWKTLKMEIIKRTVLTALWAALWPIQVLAVASNVDNPFNRASNRSQKAGQLLADALINKVQGERPVTLVGYSCGATAIHACLQSLAERHAFGLVDTVVMIGTPAPSDASHWRTIHPVVSGKIFNVYSENDMVLAFVYRMHSLSLGVAGLQAIKDVQGIENVNLSDRVSGHLRYSSLTGEILRRCGFDGVQAASEIEKDEVIKLQEQHAHEQGQDLITFDGEASKPTAGESNIIKASDDLRDLALLPPIQDPSSETISPPPKTTYTRISTRHSITSPRGHQHNPQAPLAFTTNPNQPTNEPPRSHSPDPNDSEDEGHIRISMVDLDDDDDEDDDEGHGHRSQH